MATFHRCDRCGRETENIKTIRHGAMYRGDDFDETYEKATELCEDCFNLHLNIIKPLSKGNNTND